jgi:hypothetical protein
MADIETQATDDRTNGFLDVEEVARGLAARLSRLDEEANRYAAAAANLDAAAQATRDLTTAIREVGEGAAEALDVVASVGGPEIIDRLAALDARTAEDSALLLKRVWLAVSVAGAAAVLAAAATLVALLK